MMKVEIWSDFVCQNSYLGRRNLMAALDQFPYREYVAIEYKSYPLTHQTKMSKNENLLETANNLSRQINEQVKNELDTLVAHRLVHFSKTKEKSCEVVEKIFHAHFVEKKVIDDLSTLFSIAIDVGLCHEEVEMILSTNKYKRQVEFDQDEARQMGVNQLPFIVINEAYAISGIHSVSDYLQVLAEIWEEIKEQPRYKARKMSAKTSFCTGDHCE